MLNVLLTRGALTLTRETTDTMIGYILGDGIGGVVVLAPLVAADVANAIMDDLEGPEPGGRAPVADTPLPLPSLPAIPDEVAKAFEALANGPMSSLVATVAIHIKHDAVGSPMRWADAIEEALDVIEECRTASRERQRKAEAIADAIGPTPPLVNGSPAKVISKQDIRDAMKDVIEEYEANDVEIGPWSESWKVISDDLISKLFGG